jgi:hypothetical protein
MAFSNETSPATTGYSIGTTYKRTVGFIGRGWEWSEWMPGRIQLESPTGLYIEHGMQENYLSTNIEFLFVPKGCICAFLPMYEALNRFGLITIPCEQFNYFVGRAEFSSGQAAVVKIQSHTNAGFYLNEEGKFAEKTGDEALVCETLPPTVSTSDCGGLKNLFVYILNLFVYILNLSFPRSPLDGV